MRFRLSIKIDRDWPEFHSHHVSTPPTRFAANHPGPARLSRQLLIIPPALGAVERLTGF
jgi:hypothetical protein